MRRNRTLVGPIGLYFLTGAESGDGVREQWTVAPPQGGAALVDASVEWRDGTGTRAMTGRSAILCR